MYVILCKVTALNDVKSAADIDRRDIVSDDAGISTRVESSSVPLAITGSSVRGTS